MPPSALKPEALLRPTPRGLWCEPGDFYIDPPGPVDRAVITHGHADHARAGHGSVLAGMGLFRDDRLILDIGAGRMLVA